MVRVAKGPMKERLDLSERDQVRMVQQIQATAEVVVLPIMEVVMEHPAATVAPVLL